GWGSEPALGASRRGEEVHDRAAAVAGLAVSAPAADDDRLLRLPDAVAVGLELDVDFLTGTRVVGRDLDRLAEHRRDPECVECAHRVRLVPDREANAVNGRLAREGV